MIRAYRGFHWNIKCAINCRIWHKSQHTDVKHNQKVFPKCIVVDVYNDKYLVRLTFFPSLYLTCPSITGLSSPIFLGENFHRYVVFSVILNSDSPEMSFKTFHWAFNFADKSRFYAETEHFATFTLLFPSLFTRITEPHWRLGDLCCLGAQSPWLIIHNI